MRARKARSNLLPIGTPLSVLRSCGDEIAALRRRQENSTIAQIDKRAPVYRAEVAALRGRLPRYGVLPPAFATELLCVLEILREIERILPPEPPGDNVIPFRRRA